MPFAGVAGDATVGSDLHRRRTNGGQDVPHPGFFEAPPSFLKLISHKKITNAKSAPKMMMISSSTHGSYIVQTVLVVVVFVGDLGVFFCCVCGGWVRNMGTRGVETEVMRNFKKPEKVSQRSPTLFAILNPLIN